MRPSVLTHLFLTTTLAGLDATAATKLEPIPSDWQMAGRKPVAIASAAASAFLGEQYAPRNIHDGNRRTKWVTPVAPSSAAPQWIALTLVGGPQAVDAVAVFGEAINNDGILDADIQAEVKGRFLTVAELRNAPSASWLATFDPVHTSRVRLLVFRSGGPSPHTDVYEAEVFGRPLTGEQLRAFRDEFKLVVTARLAEIRANCAAVAGALGAIDSMPTNFPVAYGNLLAKLGLEKTELEKQFGQWTELTDEQTAALASKADQTAALASRLRERAGRFAAGSKARLTALSALRTRQSPLTQQSGMAGPAVAQMGEGQVLLGNSLLVISADSGEGTWSANWSGEVNVTITSARFSVEVDGEVLPLTNAATSTSQFRDALGKGQELRHVWRAGGVRVERELRLYDSTNVMTLGGRIFNERGQDARLGTARLIELAEDGRWWLGPPTEPPAAVFIQSRSLLRARPFETPESFGGPEDRNYSSSGVLVLAGREPAAALIVGYARADEASPDLAAAFRPETGGTKLTASSPFLGRVLPAGESVELNHVYVAAVPSSFQALEAYGDAMAAFSARPVHTGPTSLWCSWYAHRMAMTEEKVLANAEVAAKHFRPLGLEIMQLDHGWQRGDITGDWVPNERFPHGLKWLAEQLRDKYGLRLGVWISPTDAAETSELFQRHPDWMLKGDDGKPRVNWRWYWKPNPNCYELDASHPDAFRYIADTFRQLTDWGVSYYKIDFIASAGGEHFRQHDPKVTRGWGVLRKAMEAIRAGAGESAWIRYCQTPPILSTGLANSTIGGDDTLDAGVPGYFHLLSDNAHALAAGYWLNDRGYHREVCDMSVRMQASVEEARVRAAMMTLANCSISWSDEFCHLPPSRIRLMQQCLPPGNPPMKPLDLFERDVPSVWHIKVKHAADAWDVVGLFNFNAGNESRSVRFEQLGLDPKADYAVFEFWESKFVGVHRGGIELSLPPQSSRILSIRRLTGVPQLIGTDMHMLQGWHELRKLAWDATASTLSGVYRRMPGIGGRAFFRLPEGFYPKFEFPLSPASAHLTQVGNGVWMQEVDFTEAEVAWTIPFEPPKKLEAKEPTL